MTVTVEHRIHIHAGGSKFYETLLITRPKHKLGSSVLIKRYGPLKSADSGGGQLKIEDFETVTAAENERDRIWKEKNKPKEYGAPMSINHGFGLVVGGVETYEDDNMQALFDGVTNHYAGDSDTAETILSFIGWRNTFDPNAGKGPAETEWKPTETEDFGSW